MRVGFLNNQIDNRGTGNAVFDYAHYNEEILGNESVILTLDTQPRDQLMEERLLKRFKYIFPWQYTYHTQKLDVLYHIKSGEDDGFRPSSTSTNRYAVHGVFKCPDHGDRRAAVSHWLSGLCGVSSVPHIVRLPNVSDNYRDSLGLREDAVVFARYGGSDSFDVVWVWDAVGTVLDQRLDVFFMFANTDGIPHEIQRSPRVAVFNEIGDPVDKKRFINTADAMLHARGRGETFGIAVGEFASSGKPVITYGGSPEQAHYLELPYAEKYHDKEELVDILMRFQPYTVKGYLDYTPEKVMKTFKEIFLD